MNQGEDIESAIFGQLGSPFKRVILFIIDPVRVPEPTHNVEDDVKRLLDAIIDPATKTPFGELPQVPPPPHL